MKCYSIMDIRPVVFQKDYPQLKALHLRFIDWAWHQMKEVNGIETIPFDDKYQTNLERKAKESAKLYGSVTPPEGLFYLLWENNEAIGMGGFFRYEDAIAEVKRMYIDPKYQGRGYGKMLVRRIIVDAKTMKYTSLRLDSMKLMHAAHQVYRSCGFKERSPYHRKFNRHADEIMKYFVFMELNL